MEQGFDFSNLKWIVMFAVFVLYKFLSAKPKVEEFDTQEGETTHEGETLTSVLEEIFGEQKSSRRTSEEEEKIEIPRVPRAPKRVENPRMETARKSGLGSEISASQIGEDSLENHASIADDFDLRQAVIMSEILTRKYDE